MSFLFEYHASALLYNIALVVLLIVLMVQSGRIKELKKSMHQLFCDLGESEREQDKLRKENKRSAT